jgi:hypothetical protein
MAQLVKMPLEGGGEILIEAVDSHGTIPVSGNGKVVQASETVRKAMGNIRSAAEAVLGELRAMEQPPSKVNVQFGIKVTGEANLASPSRQARRTSTSPSSGTALTRANEWIRR